MFNFQGVEIPKQESYLKPGVYSLSIKNAEYSSPLGKTPSLNVTFESEDGNTFTNKFYITEKTMPQFQYIHYEYFGNQCVQSFNNEQELANYFITALLSKKQKKNILISGESVDGKVYGRLGLSFIVADGTYQLGEFVEGTPLFNRFVKVKEAFVKTNDVMIPPPITPPTPESITAESLPF
jgi:hypothetical protein